MAQRLSCNTLSGPFIYVSTGLLLVVFCLWAGQQQHGYYLVALGWLGLLALRTPSCWWYQVTLTADTLRLRRLFTLPINYPLADFRELEATNKHGRPVRISFADGRSYLFQPVLKESAWALRYVPVMGFMAYWTEQLREPARFEGQVWLDDVI